MTLGVVAIVGASISLAACLIALRLPGPAAQPAPDRWHTKTTPATGGFALLVGVLLAFIAGENLGHDSRVLAYVALGAAAAFAIGVLDDQRWIGARTKFAGQIVVAAGTATALYPHWLPGVVAIPVATLILVAAMNSFNFLDNIDGLAAGTAAIALGAFALMTVSAGSAALRVIGCAGAAACAGFLPLNYRPGRSARLFMGDSGSHLLGLLVGSSALLAARSDGGTGTATVLAPLLILALPIVDTGLVIAVRLSERRPIWKGGTDHISHRLVYVGLSEQRAVASLLGLEAACAGVGLVVAEERTPLVTGGALGIVLALLLALASRLTLVTERRIEVDAPAGDRGHMPPEHEALAREAHAPDDLETALVEAASDYREDSERRARAS